ncbi:MAG: DUF4912 domain-containing protein [Blastocatellia bacterium]
MPLFFDLTSAFPLGARNPFAPVALADEDAAPPVAAKSAIPLDDPELDIPARYDINLMRAVIQDPFHLYTYWQTGSDPFARLRRIFPAAEVASFTTSLRLTDQTNNISVWFDAGFTQEYWFSVFPDRTYQVELGVRSPRHGWIRLLASDPVNTPRVTPSEQTAEEAQYQISADDYVAVLRDSHLVPERAFTPEGILGAASFADEFPAELSESFPPAFPDAETAPRQGGLPGWLPVSFRRILKIMADAQAGREYDRFWERLSQEELTAMTREFIDVLAKTGNNELGYLLLLRYLPELLRRAIAAEGKAEIATDKPITLYLAEQLGQAASEWNAAPAPAFLAGPAVTSQPPPGKWAPSMGR